MMVIQPKIRGFICTTAHPIGCHEAVAEEIAYVKKKGPIKGPKNVLVIGGSTGYGLASRVVATFAAQAKTIGVAFEKEADEKRTATAGWYNTAAFEKLALTEGLYAKSINGDAFSQAVKEQAADLIRQDMGKVDLIIYSLASPRRTDPTTGMTYQSALKPIGKSFNGKTVDAFRSEVKEVSIEPASQQEVDNTVKVMGGEDWEMWIDYLKSQDLLADNVVTVAYTYLGPQITHDIYKDGTIGKAKEHLKLTSDKLNAKLKAHGGQAVVSVNKAVVTQSSAAIPVVPLYIALLFKIMKVKGTHEGCVEQIYRLFAEHLYAHKNKPRDVEGYIRIDDREMDPEVQKEIINLWAKVNTENLNDLTDIAGYRTDFYRLFGFAFENVNYEADVTP